MGAAVCASLPHGGAVLGGGPITSMPAVDDPSTLSLLPLFQGLPLEHLAAINERLYRRTVPASTTLMMAEDPGDVDYIIQSGTVKIHVEQTDGSDVILALRGRGEILGEMSILDRQGRSASVLTIEQCSMLAGTAPVWSPPWRRCRCSRSTWPACCPDACATPRTRFRRSPRWTCGAGSRARSWPSPTSTVSPWRKGRC